MTELVGYTGFVGGNIYSSAGDEIQKAYNSKNIAEAFGTSPDLLIYAGVRAEKYLANNAPDKDMEQIKDAEENIRKIDPHRLVLISTIDVFKTPKGVDEESEIITAGLHPYGYNRYRLEAWVREHYPNALIIRLPALFGKGIKKNFIYDLINVIPFMLKEAKFEELSSIDPGLADFYEKQSNGFFRVRDLDPGGREALKGKFKKLGFSAVNFTDSRSRYQFYDLERLWRDIHTALDHGITLWHPATEPVSAAEVYKYLTGEDLTNELNGTPADYDYRTLYSEEFGGTGGYICNREQILEQIGGFVNFE